MFTPLKMTPLREKERKRERENKLTSCCVTHLLLAGTHTHTHTNTGMERLLRDKHNPSSSGLSHSYSHYNTCYNDFTP